MKRSAVKYIVILGVGGLASPAMSENDGVCRVAVGSCPVESSKNGEICYCPTVFGSLQGETQSGTTVSPVTDLLKQVDRDSKSLKSITLQIFGIDAAAGGSKKLNLWLSTLDSLINVVISKSRNEIVLRDDKIDAVWFTTDIPESMIRLCAFSLAQNGILIKSIEKYIPDASEGRPVRSRTIQIGRSAGNRSIKELTVQQILNEPFPMSGN